MNKQRSREEARQAAQQADTVPDVGTALADLSEEEIQALGCRAQSLVAKNPRISRAFFSLVSAVRLYNVAVAAIHDECVNEKLGERSAAIAYVLMQSAKSITSKEFLRTDLAAHVQQHVLEFLAMEVSLEQERDNRVLAADRRAEHEARKVLPVCVGHALHSRDQNTIKRGRTLLLAGPELLLDRLVESAVSAANTAKQTAINLSTRLISNLNISREANRNLWRSELGANTWVGIAASPAKLRELLGRQLHRMRGNRLDLLVASELSLVAKEANILTRLAAAHNAHRLLRKFADQAGAAMLACLPCEEYDWCDRDWDRLEVYTDLRFVRERNDSIEIGTRDGTFWPALPDCDGGPTDGCEDDPTCDSGLQVPGEERRESGPTGTDNAEEL